MYMQERYDDNISVKILEIDSYIHFVKKISFESHDSQGLSRIVITLLFMNPFQKLKHSSSNLNWKLSV